jgi:DNA mismatch repair protein MutL
VVSRVDGQQAGVRLNLEGGSLLNREAVGAPVGTVLAVSNLFFNVPARKKFLKSVGTEKRLIDETVTRYALAYPQARFRLAHDGRITFQTTGSGDHRDVLIAIYGPETARQLIAIGGDGPASDPQTATGDLSVAGYISPPHLNWSNRNRIAIYVNNRWIKDNRLTYAVVQAYHTLLPNGRYPMALIFVTMAPEHVDVNVHPAKTEVRFRQANMIFGAVQRAVRAALVAEGPVPSAGHFASLGTSNWAQGHQTAFSRREPGGGLDHEDAGWNSPPDSGLPGIPTGRTEEGRLPIIRVIGQVGSAYIITEGPDGLYLIDQHAAHERILYEQFMADWRASESPKIATQGLISGQTVDLSPAQMSMVEEYNDLLGQIGFDIELFGPKTIMVRGIPGLLTNLDPARAIMGVIEELEAGETPLVGAIEERIILRVCKSAAVKAGQILSMTEMEAMVRQLEACQTPLTCPHGRPTTIYLSVSQLAREFGRR